MGKLFMSDAKFKDVKVSNVRRGSAGIFTQSNDFAFVIVDKSPIDPNAPMPLSSDPWRTNLSRSLYNRYDVLVSVDGVAMRMSGEDFVNMCERMQDIISIMGSAR